MQKKSDDINESSEEVFSETHSLPETPQSFKFVYSHIYPQALQVFSCFFITFIVFPGITNKPMFKFLIGNEQAITWNNLILIFLFNVFDTLGRYLGGWKQIFTPKTTIYLTVGRSIFILTSFLIFYHTFLYADFFMIINMILFAFTNGYGSTLNMIYGPMLVQDEHKEKGGMIMAFHLVGGICFGSFVAIAFGNLKPPT